MIGRLISGVGNIRHRNIRMSLEQGRLDRLKRDLDHGYTLEEALWAWTMRMKPTGCSGAMVKAGIRAWVASASPFRENGSDTWADALVSASEAMRLEVKVKHSEDPRPCGLVHAAWVMSEIVRLHGYDIPKMVAVLEKLEGACRHGDPGSRAVIDFLEGF